MAQSLVSEGIFIIARGLISFYFLKAGYNNLKSFKRMTDVLRYKKMPLPELALGIALMLQIGGSLSLLFNYYATAGAAALILFTFASNYYFCRYWLVQGAEKRYVQFLFYANLAVIGGLLVFIGWQL